MGREITFYSKFTIIRKISQKLATMRERYKRSDRKKGTNDLRE